MSDANEETPLIAVVRVAPRRQRYSHSTIRRFCSTFLGIALVVVVILFLLPLEWLPWRRHKHPNHGHDDEGWPPRPFPPGPEPELPHKSWPWGDGLNYKELQEVLLSTPEPEKAREWSQYYTAGPHLAGKNLSQALWTKERWEEFGVENVDIVAYDVYINYPVGHRLALLRGNEKVAELEDFETSKKNKTKSKYDVLYEAVLEEDVLESDPTTALEDRVPTFHGYSASGNVTAQYVYVNFGTYWDFEDLVKANVSLSGKIALAKYGRIFRGLKVKRAQELGMIGVVMYSDPQEDGNVTEENGYKAYPRGPARNPSSVQRGSVQFLSIAPGDPTTPGYPSLPGVPRQDPHGSTASIPSLPISYQDALPILRALNGHGPDTSDFNEYWDGGGLRHKGVEYNIGPSDAYLNLVNEVEYETTPLWNVIGVINGTITDEVIILGNHRDAWIAGGAGDPNSGSAAMNEVVRSFGVALKKGWKPLRTIVFASWDGEEYGLIGSTEWVEEYLPWLSGSAIAYLNLDVGTRGPDFMCTSSPLLHKAIYDVTSIVPSPNQTVAGQTVRDLWSGHIGTIGSGSDFTAFQDFAGVPSIDFGFGADADSAVYHYHSNYDSFHWMDKFGDAGWHYHATIAKVWALLAARMVETPVIALNTSDYAAGLEQYLQTVQEKAHHNSSSSSSSSPSIHLTAHVFRPLRVAIDGLRNAAEAFDANAAALEQQIEDKDGIPWWQPWKRMQLWKAVRAHNVKVKMLEREFLHQPGLDGRSWFKHVVYAPGIWTGYAGATYPGIVEGLEAGNRTTVDRWTTIIAAKVKAAARLLE